MLEFILIMLTLVSLEAAVTTGYLFVQFSDNGGMVPAGIALLRFAVAIGLAGVIEAIRMQSKGNAVAAAVVPANVLPEPELTPLSEAVVDRLRTLEVLRQKGQVTDEERKYIFDKPKPRG